MEKSVGHDFHDFQSYSGVPKGKILRGYPPDITSSDRLPGLCEMVPRASGSMHGLWEIVLEDLSRRQ